MPQHLRSFLVLTALLSVVFLVTSGCGQSVPPGEERAATSDESPDDSGVKLARAEGPIRPPEKSTEAPGASKDPEAPAELPRTAPRAPLPLDNVDTADLTMPSVSLTEPHAAMCLVKVGDQFPDLKLPDLAGEAKTLADLAGEKLTLVVFWNGSEPTALEQLADLARYHQPRFADQGLEIVAINTGDDPQLAGELAKQAGAKFAVLCDADGSVFKQVATAKLPRSYLVDPAGQILWFDLEYSATTRRDMVQAIRFSLAHE